MRNEVLNKFIARVKHEQLPFDQSHETYEPKKVTVQGRVQEGNIMVSAKVGFLKNSTAREVKFLIDSGAEVTLLTPKDAKHLLRAEVPVENGSVKGYDGGSVRGAFFNTEVWLKGLHFQQEALIAIKILVFVPNNNVSGPSLLGINAFSHFKKVEIDLTDGEIVFNTRNSDKTKFYRKIK